MGGTAVLLFIAFIIFMHIAYIISATKPATASVIGIPVTNTTLLRIMACMPLVAIMLTMFTGPLLSGLGGVAGYVTQLAGMVLCMALCIAGAVCGRYLLRNSIVWRRLFFMVSLFIGSVYGTVCLLMLLFIPRVCAH